MIIASVNCWVARARIPGQTCIIYSIWSTKCLTLQLHFNRLWVFRANSKRRHAEPMPMEIFFFFPSISHFQNFSPDPIDCARVAGRKVEPAEKRSIAWGPIRKGTKELDSWIADTSVIVQASEDWGPKRQVGSDRTAHSAPGDWCSRQI